MPEPLNDVIDALKPLFDKIKTVIQGYKDEAQMWKDKADALEAAATELQDSGNVVDPAHADALRGFADTLTPLLPPAAAAPVADPVVPVSDPMPVTETAATGAATAGQL